MNNLGKRDGNQKIKIVCAWCGKDMGEKEGEGVEGVSHGVCNPCLDKLQAKTENGISANGEQGEHQI